MCSIYVAHVCSTFFFSFRSRQAQGAAAAPHRGGEGEGAAGVGGAGGVDRGVPRAVHGGAHGHSGAERRQRHARQEVSVVCVFIYGML